MSDTRPKVSVVVATRDRTELLQRAVTSIRGQVYDGVVETIVVVDGGQPPEQLTSDDERRPVRITSNRRQPGLAGARNTGIGAAGGQLVAFCDDDDVWREGKLEAQFQALERHPDALLAVTGMSVVWGDRRVDRVHPDDRIGLDAFIRSRVQEVHPSSFLWRVEAFDRIGLVDEELPGAYGEDHDLLLRVAREADIVNVPEVLVDIYWHDGSFFMDRWATIDEAIVYLMDKHPEFARSATGSARMLGRRAFAKAACEDRTGAAAMAAQALRRRPLDKRAWVALLVASGAVSAARAQRLANSVGHGI